MRTTLNLIAVSILFLASVGETRADTSFPDPEPDQLPICCEFDDGRVRQVPSGACPTGQSPEDCCDSSVFSGNVTRVAVGYCSVNENLAPKVPGYTWAGAGLACIPLRGGIAIAPINPVAGATCVVIGGVIAGTCYLVCRDAAGTIELPLSFPIELDWNEPQRNNCGLCKKLENKAVQPTKPFKKGDLCMRDHPKHQGKQGHGRCVLGHIHYEVINQRPPPDCTCFQNQAVPDVDCYEPNEIGKVQTPPPLRPGINEGLTCTWKEE